MSGRLFTIITVALLVLPLSLVAQSDEVAIPELRHQVTDLTATLSHSQINELNRALAQYEREKGIQIAVLVVPTTKPEEIEQYSIRVVEKWKLGRRGVDDGVLLLIAKNDRRIRIEVGYGLEGALTDFHSKRIINRLMLPFLKEGEYYNAITAGIAGILETTRDEPLPESVSRHRGGSRKGSSNSNYFIFMIILSALLGGMLRAKFGRLAGGAVAGGVGGVAAMLIYGSLVISLVLGFIVFIYILLGRMGGGGLYSSDYHGSWGSGGGFGGFGGGSFGGGGGGFGGGGASGGW